MKKPPVAVNKTVITPGVRRYLYLTAALTGAAIMIVEILGAKMLSPYVGTSHFVWTAQIAVTLVALAAGYYVGGRVVDRSAHLGRLYWCILAAAVYLTLTASACEPLAYWCLQFNLAVGSLLASALLFFVPLALLAITGPFVVRVITSAVDDVGSTMGRLTAISTLGSFVGTMLIGYLLIPFFPNSVTLYCTALALMLGCVGYFVIWGRKANSLALVAIVTAVGIIAGYAGSRPPVFQNGGGREVYCRNSNYGLMQVVDFPYGGERYYLDDYRAQNGYVPASKKSTEVFTYMLHGLARAYTANINDILCIGMGVGIVPMQFANEGARVDAVEINPAVVPVAADYFDLKLDKLNITIGDGRFYLNRCRKHYDAVILDACQGDSQPSHLMTREALTAICHVLKPGGTLVINTFGNFEPGRDFFTASLHKTLKAVFPGVRIHAHPDGNVIFVASDRAKLGFVRQPETDDAPPGMKQGLETAFATTADTNPAHGRILTDDFNPVDFFDAKNREQSRRNYALWVKTLRGRGDV